MLLIPSSSADFGFGLHRCIKPLHERVKNIAHGTVILTLIVAQVNIDIDLVELGPCMNGDMALTEAGNPCKSCRRKIMIHFAQFLQTVLINQCIQKLFEGMINLSFASSELIKVAIRCVPG